MGQGISLKRERNKYFHIEFCDFFKISKQILDFYDKSTNIVVIKKSFLSLINSVWHMRLVLNTSASSAVTQKIRRCQNKTTSEEIFFLFWQKILFIRSARILGFEWQNTTLLKYIHSLIYLTWI